MEKLKKGIDVFGFLKEVRQCKGSVIFKTDEGDVLNLKSALSRYVFSVAVTMPQAEGRSWVECENPEDYTALESFLEKEAM